MICMEGDSAKVNSTETPSGTTNDLANHVENYLDTERQDSSILCFLVAIFHLHSFKDQGATLGVIVVAVAPDFHKYAKPRAGFPFNQALSLSSFLLR
jgi:hypothetical protein